MFGNAIRDVVIPADQATTLSADKAKSAQSQTKNYIFSNIIGSKSWERKFVVEYFIVLHESFDFLLKVSRRSQKSSSTFLMRKTHIQHCLVCFFYCMNNFLYFDAEGCSDISIICSCFN